MHFEKGYIYHIYNQGNNRQMVFFNRENYLFFLRKIRKHILPYGDILAWCLMPNHFHLMVYIREVELKIGSLAGSLGVSLRNAETKITGHTKAKHTETYRTFNTSIGIMLMSYTKAFNKQNTRTGKLFREATKAECINCPKGLTPSFIIKSGITQINIQDSEKQYPQVCFDYIHQNPVKARMVKDASDWEFSSASDYNNLRSGNLVNKKVAGEYFKI